MCCSRIAYGTQDAACNMALVLALHAGSGSTVEEVAAEELPPLGRLRSCQKAGVDCL
jgi:hypothetical protein